VHPGLVDHVVAPDAAGGVEHPDATAVVDELEEVAVAGDDIDRTLRRMGDGADDVVGLVAVGADRRHAESRQHVLDDRHLRDERVGHLLLVAGGDAVRLVRRDRLDPEGRPPVVVHRGDQMGRGAVGDQSGDEVEQSADGVDRRTVRRGDAVGDPEEGPEVERGRVQQQQLPRRPGHAVRMSRRLVIPLRRRFGPPYAPDPLR
jgi:hypothetical protein